LKEWVVLSPLKNSIMANESRTLLGFLAGVAVGVGAYAFLKSKKGQQFTEEVKKKAGEVKDELKDLVEKGKEKLTEWEKRQAAAGNN
jgi:gas vesicle protein